MQIIAKMRPFQILIIWKSEKQKVISLALPTKKYFISLNGNIHITHSSSLNKARTTMKLNSAYSFSILSMSAQFQFVS